MSDDSKPAPLTRQLTSHLDQFVQDLEEYHDAAKDNKSDQDDLKSKSQGKSDGLTFLMGESTDIGGGTVNQDTSAVFKVGDNLVLAVFDGHGRELGELAAIVARDKIQELIEEPGMIDKIAKDPEVTLTEIFETAHLEIKERFREKYLKANWQVQETDEGYLIKRKTSAGSWSCTHGGTTATVVVILAETNRMIVANVGDSTALWGGVNPEGKHIFTELSAEHSPESIAEFKRVRTFRPDQTGLMPEMRFVYDSPSFSKNLCPQVFQPDSKDPDNIRITNMGNYYKNVRSEWATLVTTPPHARFQDALAFTRSLGDLHLHVYGVSSTPEVIEYDLGELHASACDGINGASCLLVCTDGVWDNYNYTDIIQQSLKEELVHPAYENGHAMTSCQLLMDANLQLARAHFGSQADNMTAILCYISYSDSSNPPLAPK